MSGVGQVVRRRAAVVLLFALLLFAQSAGLCIPDTTVAAASSDVAVDGHCLDHHADEHMAGAPTWRGSAGVADRGEPVEVPDVTHVAAAPHQRRARRAGGRRGAPTGRCLLDRLCIART